ncbi:MAG: DNA translocase FtsK 4TM domain-containing protein [bacterium]|nr:DNA translocase FtsK 4TM domain-containing protein [bacterium]
MLISKILFALSLASSAVLLVLDIKRRGLSEDKSLYRYTAFLLLLMLSLYMFLCFANFDISALESLNRERNWGGILGFNFAFSSYTVFGWFAFFMPFFILYTGLGFIMKINNKYFPLIIFVVFLLLVPMLAGNLLGDVNSAGLYGDASSRFFSRYLGTAGLSVIIFFLLFISLLIFSEFSPLMEILAKGFKRIEQGKEEGEDENEDGEDFNENPQEEYKEREVIKPKKKEKQKKVVVKTGVDPNIDYKHLITDEFKRQFLDSLEDAPNVTLTKDDSEINDNIKILEEKMRSFQVEGRVINVNVGPVITTYEFEPAPGIKVNKITSLSDDLALAMKAKSIRILGHIPGKSAVGIEIPNKNRVTVYLKNLMTEREFIDFSDPTSIVLGRDTENNPIYAQVSTMPHLLIAGTTGSGKSVCINGIITSILFKAQPEEVRFLMVDPKRIELSIYNGVPHLERPVITDSKEAVLMLKELTLWMDLRYKAFAKLGVRDIIEFNKKSDKKKPYIIVIIDEMADLMMTSQKEIESYIIRLAQMSRAVGIHLILATQRPSVNIITGSIKANFPIRISFKVPSKADSKTILDASGADKLLGKGDMLYIAPQRGYIMRAHGAFLKTDEATAIANLWAETYMKKLFEGSVKDSGKLAKLIIENELVQCIANPSNTPGFEFRIEEFVRQYSEELEIEAEKLTEILTSVSYHIPIEESGLTKNFTRDENGAVVENEELDPLFDAARDFVQLKKQASTSMLQKHFGLGYPRAARLLDQLENGGIVGPANGSKPREVYDNFKDNDY